MGRVSQEQAARNREAVVASASRLIRRKGVDGVGIRELMAAAGMTQGAFVGQFGSKDALVAQACAHAFIAAEQAMAAIAEKDAPDRAVRIAEAYLAPKPPDQSCPMTTLAVDVSRFPPDSAVRGAFTEGLGRLARVVCGDPLHSNRLALMTAMVGAAVLRRASNDKMLTGEIEAAVTALAQSMD